MGSCVRASHPGFRAGCNALKDGPFLTRPPALCTRLPPRAETELLRYRPRCSADICPPRSSIRPTDLVFHRRSSAQVLRGLAYRLVCEECLEAEDSPIARQEENRTREAQERTQEANILFSLLNHVLKVLLVFANAFHQ